MEWSQYQKDIFEAVVNSEKHLMITARAGSGKTTTIVTAMDLTQDPSRALVAHNKHIAEELKQRTTADVRTLHSMGFQTLRDHMRQTINVSTGKGHSIARKVVQDRVKLPTTKEEQKHHRQLPDKVKRLASLIKATGVAEIWEVEDLVWEHNLYTEMYSARVLADLAIESCERSLNDKQNIDYDDMLYFPKKFNFLPRPYRVVAVDESQDLNKAQLWLIANAAQRLILVGDRQQAIYDWRGSDSKMLDLVAAKLKATLLPLSITYRCASSIVDHVKKLYPALSDFQARDDAPEGQVSYVSDTQLDPAAGDFVLCRWNAPLVKQAMKLMLRGDKVCLVGRGMAKRLQAVFAPCKEETQLGILQWISRSEAKEIDFLKKEGRLSQIATVQDKFGILRNIAKSGRDVRRTVGSLFTDVSDSNAIILSTIHRAKGLEADRVWLLEDGFIKPGVSEAEDNAQYVGITRAKTDLFRVRRSK